MWDGVTVSRSDLGSTAWSQAKYHADSRSKFIKPTNSNILIRHLADLKFGTPVLDRWSVPILLGGTAPRARTKVKGRVFDSLYRSSSKINRIKPWLENQAMPMVLEYGRR